MLTFSPSLTFPAKTAEGCTKHDFGMRGLQLRINLGAAISSFFQIVPMSSKDSSTKQIGEYLLKGWTLLGDNCPNGCNVPLMRSRDKKHLVCCGCEVDFLHQVIPSGAEPSMSLMHPEPSSVTQGPSTSCEKSSLGSIVDKKLAWAAEQIQGSTSISDLLSLVDLATKLMNLRKQLS